MTTRAPVTHVAMRFQGQVYSLPAPNRHHDVIRLIAELTGVKYVDSRDEDQGFLDADGRYLTRRQAIVSARINRQIKNPSKIRLGQLFSEDVW